MASRTMWVRKTLFPLRAALVLTAQHTHAHTHTHTHTQTLTHTDRDTAHISRHVTVHTHTHTHTHTYIHTYTYTYKHTPYHKHSSLPCKSNTVVTKLPLLFYCFSVFVGVRDRKRTRLNSSHT